PLSAKSGLRNSANLPMVRSTLLSPIGALGFYHRRVFLLVLNRAFADFSVLSLIFPKMRSQSLLEIPLNPTRKRSWCSSVFGFGVDVGVGVGVGGGVGVDVGVDVGVVSSVIFVSLPTNGHYDFYKSWKSIPPDQTLPSLIVFVHNILTFTAFVFPLFGSCPSSNVTRWPTSSWSPMNSITSLLCTKTSGCFSSRRMKPYPLPLQVCMVP